MKQYEVIVYSNIGDELIQICYEGVETISYESNNAIIKIANAEMLTANIPLYRNLYLQGKNNAVIDSRIIVSIEVRG